VRQALVIASKEFQDGLRNRWVLAGVLLLGGLALILAAVGSAPVGTIQGSTLATTVASLASLTVYVVPLVALMLSHDAIVGENERGTLLLLLSYPVTRSEVLLGKFIGHVAILAVAVSAGYGIAGLLLYFATDATVGDLAALVGLIATSILLGAVFLGLGYAMSAMVRERATSVGAAIGLWLALVVLYDLALIGVLLADTNQLMSASLLSALMLLNPADAFRMANLSALGAGFAGLGGANAQGAGAWLASGALCLWAVAAGVLAFLAFRRYEL
jgi:Cu-processing system permease protein